MWIELVGLFISAGVLIWSARWTIDVFDALVIKLKVKRLAMAAVLVALSTSLPELFVAITASLGGVGIVSVGNVMGSNVANLGLVVGLAVVVGGPVAVIGNYLKYEFIAAMSAGLAPLVLLLDGDLTRRDGVLLLVMYALYVRNVVIAGEHKSLAEKGVRRKGIIAKLMLWHRNNIDKLLARFLIGLGILIMAAEGVVRFSTLLAADWGVSLLFVGLLIVGVGTSLPELVLEIVAVKRKEVALMFGNILGSTVVNSSLVLGVTAVISPVKLVSLSGFWIAGVSFILIFIIFWCLTLSKRRLDRWEGLLLLGIYAGYVLLELFVGTV